MSEREELQADVADELQRLGLSTDLRKAPMPQGGFSRDVTFARGNFQGRVRIFRPEHLSVMMRGDQGWTRFDHMDEVVSFVAARLDEYGVRGDDPSEAAVAPSVPLRGQRQGLPSPEDLEAVRALLLVEAEQALASGDKKRGRSFLEAATKLGASAHEIVLALLSSGS